MVAESEVGVSLYLLLGSEAALADRALAKLLAQMREESAELTLLSAPDVVTGDIADALDPPSFQKSVPWFCAISKTCPMIANPRSPATLPSLIR